MSDEPDDLVRAAGGVVTRPGGVGVELLVVHRPRYDDWSLPKGKLDPGETWEEAALREVHEETGYRCHLGEEVGQVSYRDRKDRPKLVRYWAMRVVGGGFEPNDEVEPGKILGVYQKGYRLNGRTPTQGLREALGRDQLPPVVPKSGSGRGGRLNHTARAPGVGEIRNLHKWRRWLMAREG